VPREAAGRYDTFVAVRKLIRLGVTSPGVTSTGVTRRSVIGLAVLSLLWGSAWLFTPLLGLVLAPLAAGSVVCAIAAACLLPFVRLLQRGQLRSTLILATTMLALPSVLVTVANQHGASGWVPLLYALLPLLTALDAWTPAMLIASGATIVVLGGSVSFSLARLPWAGMILAAVGMQAFALRYAGRWLKQFTLKQVLGSLGLQCAISAVVLGMASLVLDPAPRSAPLAQWHMNALVGLAYGALAGTAVCYALLYLLLARGAYAPDKLATTQWLQLLIGLVEANAFARSRPSAQVVIAAVLLAGCAVVVLRGSNREDTQNISLR
jgi:drug/metabolite transporter (DMT)-like permease